MITIPLPLVSDDRTVTVPASAAFTALPAAAAMLIPSLTFPGAIGPKRARIGPFSGHSKRPEKVVGVAIAVVTGWRGVAFPTVGRAASASAGWLPVRMSSMLRRKAAARMLKAIHAQESREACARKAEEVAEELESMRLGAAARTVRDGFAETLAYTEFPPEHWRRIRTNNGIERINREIRRRTRVVGTFPDGNSALMLVTARLKYIVEHEWGKRRYLDMSKLEEMDGLRGKAED